MCSPLVEPFATVTRSSAHMSKSQRVFLMSLQQTSVLDMHVNGFLACSVVCSSENYLVQCL